LRHGIFESSENRGLGEQQKKRKEKREEKGMMSYKLTLTLPPLQHTVHNRILCQVVSAKVNQKVSFPVKWRAGRRGEGVVREPRVSCERVKQQ
jgi:hypothetical protein